MPRTVPPVAAAPATQASAPRSVQPAPVATPVPLDDFLAIPLGDESDTLQVAGDTQAQAPAPVQEQLALAVPAPAPVQPVSIAGGAVARGMASWYGPGFAGRHTANGEVFNPNELTAAHRTLPFNTRVQVTNLATGLSVIVRINDRGPFRDNRIIDLSRAAADVIGLTSAGVGEVELVTISGGGVTTTAEAAHLTPLEVIARGRALGELLLLSSALDSNLEPVLVRVVGGDVPPEAGADLLVSSYIYELLGTDVLVNGE